MGLLGDLWGCWEIYGADGMGVGQMGGKGARRKGVGLMGG